MTLKHRALACVGLSALFTGCSSGTGRSERCFWGESFGIVLPQSAHALSEIIRGRPGFSAVVSRHGHVGNAMTGKWYGDGVDEAERDMKKVSRAPDGTPAGALLVGADFRAPARVVATLAGSAIRIKYRCVDLVVKTCDGISRGRKRQTLFRMYYLGPTPRLARIAARDVPQKGVVCTVWHEKGCEEPRKLGECRVGGVGRRHRALLRRRLVAMTARVSRRGTIMIYTVGSEVTVRGLAHLLDDAALLGATAALACPAETGEVEAGVGVHRP
jgi:hypothetical protein